MKLSPVKSLSRTENRSGLMLLSAGILILLAIYGAVVSTLLLVDSPSIAYVDSGAILKKYTGAIEANKKYEEESAKWQSNIQTLQSELDSLNLQFVQNADKWSLTKKRDIATYAKKREQDLSRYSQAIQQKAAGRQQELLSPVLVEINNTIADYGKDHGYKMIFGTTDGNIVYADGAVNVTEEILALLNGE